MPPLHDTARHVTRFGDLSVLFVMATEQEYGPHLRRRIDPLMTGVGPVEAAADLAIALATLHHKGGAPDLVFTLGSAGSRVLDNAAVYQMKSVAYRDMDASILGFEKGVTPFLDHPAVIEIPHQIPGIPSASLATGGSIVSGAGNAAIGADMVDMESFAVLRAA
ncbi:MAG: 5'-methylthioadenosine/S-adenosylhomocysteine nucleosidase, partial [Bauldia sp.]